MNADSGSVRYRATAEEIRTHHVTLGSAPSKYFRLRGGFKCGTRALQWDGARMWIHPKKGPRAEADCYSLEYAETCVREGAWEELSSLPTDKAEPCGRPRPATPTPGMSRTGSPKNLNRNTASVNLTSRKHGTTQLHHSDQRRQNGR